MSFRNLAPSDLSTYQKPTLIKITENPRYFLFGQQKETGYHICYQEEEAANLAHAQVSQRKTRIRQGD
jgi:hypothetical protein